MNRKLYLIVTFDESKWGDYADVHPQLLLEDSGLLDGIKDGVSAKILERDEDEEETWNRIKAEKLNTFIMDNDIKCYVISLALDEEDVKLPIKEFEEIDKVAGVYTAFSEEETLMYHYLTEEEIVVEVSEEFEPITFSDLLEMFEEDCQKNLRI